MILITSLQAKTFDYKNSFVRIEYSQQNPVTQSE